MNPDLKGKEFSSEYQPSPESKRRGWLIRSLKRDLLNEVLKLKKKGTFGNKWEQLNLFSKDVATSDVNNEVDNYQKVVQVMSDIINTPVITDCDEKRFKMVLSMIDSLAPKEFELSGANDKLQVIFGGSPGLEKEKEI
jgi:hypothetical protein